MANGLNSESGKRLPYKDINKTFAFCAWFDTYELFAQERFLNCCTSVKMVASWSKNILKIFWRTISFISHSVRKNLQKIFMKTLPEVKRRGPVSCNKFFNPLSIFPEPWNKTISTAIKVSGKQLPAVLVRETSKQYECIWPWYCTGAL